MPSPLDRTRSQEQEASQAPSGSRDVDETITGPAPESPAPVFAPPDAPGEVGRLGPYRLFRLLGRGGMGAVYAALDTRLGRRLALKVMLPKLGANAAARERFLREARAAAQITHDNVVTVYEADERDGLPYIAMQFLMGYPLDQYLKRKKDLDIPQVLRIGRETAAGLAAAHHLGLVHRDIKPANLWLEAPHGRIKLLDFGLARPMDAEVELTGSGVIVGTPAYMSPEQARGLRVDHRTDLFSLGAVLYRLCAGRTPFGGSTTMAVLTALAVDEPTPLRQLNPQVPEGLAVLIHQLLRKDREQRPASAAEVAARLRQLAGAAAVQPHDDTVAAGKSVVAAAPVMVTNVWADINIPDEQTAARAVAPAGRGKLSGTAKKWLVGLMGAAALLLAGGIIIKITHRDGTKTTIEVPDGAKVTIRVPKKPKAVAKVIDPDRTAAEYVMDIGGVVRVSDLDNDIRLAADLPRERFRLTSVNLQDNKRVSDEGLAHFKGCENLTYLNLWGAPVSDAGLAHFKDCKNLRQLILTYVKLSDKGLAVFNDCKDLEYIDVQCTQIGDAGLAHFKDCKKLTGITLQWCQRVSDAGVAYLKDCKKLTFISLHRTQVTDKGLSYLRGCHNMRDLFLWDTRIGDAGLAFFKDCKKITRLGLSNTQVSDVGLAYFKDCKSLQELILHDTNVSDVGLAYFRDCMHLTHIDLRKTKVTAAMIEELKKALPRCKIEWDGK